LSGQAQAECWKMQRQMMLGQERLKFLQVPVR
jgi:hypothetical protein